MLRTERPELVASSRPDHLHRGVVEVAIEAGARGIFCEKPIATTLEDADAIVTAVRAAGVTMNVNYTRRWFPEFVEARRIVRERRDRQLSQIVIEMGGPRSMLFRNHTHAHRPGQLPRRLRARLGVGRASSPGYEDYGLEYAGDGGNDPATEPGGNYYVAFANGVRAYLTGMKDTVGLDTAVTLTGSDGRIVVDLEGVRIHSVHPRGHPDQARRHDDPAGQAASGRSPACRPASRTSSPRWTRAATTASPPEQARTTVAVTQAILMSQSPAATSRSDSRNSPQPRTPAR